MAVELTRVERLYVDIPVTATLRNGSPATVTAVDVALVAPRTKPTGSTAWIAATYASGTATVLIAGPDATSNPAGTLVVAADSDLYFRVVDTPEIDVAYAGRVTLT